MNNYPNSQMNSSGMTQDTGNIAGSNSTTYICGSKLSKI